MKSRPVEHLTFDEKTIERFEVKVFPLEGGCWYYTGSKNENGYGRFHIRKQEQIRSHRFAYLIYRGPIPEGLTIDHLCRNRACVNPNHLEAVPWLDNIRRGYNPSRDKTKCPRGHDYNSVNTYRWGGRRMCRECRRVQKLEFRRRHK